LGRFCILCEHIRPNEAFGGKGRRARICRKCRRLPREQQDRLLHEREILGFLGQSHISHKNVARLRALAGSANAHIAGLATLVRDVATVAPHRRRRIRTLARQRRDLLKRMEVARLISPRTEWEDCDLEEIDPVVAWYEWAEYAKEFARE
jgi:sugar phosphate isomerase/epimerase